MPQLKISKRETVFISVLLFTLGIYLYLNYMLFPQYNRINALKQDINKKRNISMELQNKGVELERIKTDINRINSEISFTEKQIPYTKRIPEMLITLDAKVSQYKLKLLSIAFDEAAQKDNGAENVMTASALTEAINASLSSSAKKQADGKENEDYSEIPIGLSIEGKYDDIIGFMKYMENADRKYIIDSFRLEPNNRKKPMAVSLEFRTFVLKDQEKTFEEPVDYPFLTGKLGKEYPFLDNPIPPPQDNSNILQNYINNLNPGTNNSGGNINVPDSGTTGAEKGN